MDLYPWYLKIAKRLLGTDVERLMQRWEFLEKRSALLDSISSLRMVVGAAITDDDLMHVLQHLFLQQRAGIRKSLTCNTRTELNGGTITKALLVRRNLFIHLKNVFPKCQDVIEQYASFEFYNMHRGVDLNGERGDVPVDDEDGSDADEAPEAPSSVQKSRKLLETFCSNLASNKYERTLAKMGKEHVSSNTIDLTTPTAKVLMSSIHDVQSFYVTDFADAPADAPTVVVHASAGHEVRVQVLADDLTEASYRDKSQQYDQAVKKFEDAKCNEYLKQHMLGYVIDTMVVGDGVTHERVAAKVEQVCNRSGVGKKDMKRKLFVSDHLCDKAIDWPKHKKNRWSVFNSKDSSKLNKEDLDPLIEIYEVNKASNCEDVIAIITSGPPANTPLDRNRIVAHARLKTLQPKHQTTKIGTIEINRADILQRTKNKNAFVGQNEHHMIFTTQSKTKAQRKSFSVLQGDSFFNKSTYL